MNLKTLIPAILFCAVVSVAQPPYSTWLYYRDVTVNTTGSGANVPGSVTNLPLLVRLTNASASTGADVLSGSLSANGADIRFTDSTGNTALSYQIDSWSGISAAVWVLVPSIAGNANTKIRIYWGKSGQTSLSNGGAVFDTANGFRSVWHMGDATGVNPRPNAVTAYSTLTAQPRNYPNSYNPVVNGVIGSADTLLGGSGGLANDGNGTYMMIDSGTATDAYTFPNGKFTVSFWANHARFGFNKRHFHLQASPLGAANPAAALQTIPSTQTPNANMYFRYSTNAGTTGTYIGSNTGGMNLTLNTWMHITCVVARGPTSDTLYKYYNGVLNSAGTVIAAAASPLPSVQRNYAFLGRAFESASDSAFGGSLDEIELANASRSPDWIKLSYETQKPGATAVTLGPTQNTASVPGAPTAVTGTASNGRVALSWMAPASDGGGTITAYTATSSPGGLTCSTTGGTACTVTGLTNGAGYTFTVTATNVAGTGPASAPSATYTPTAPSGVPGAPTNVTGTAGNAQVSVSWLAGTAGSSATTGYTVISNPDSRMCTTTGALTCAVTALTNGVPYTFTVYATNASGSSLSSSPSNPVTPVGAPSAPTNVTGVAGNAQVAVSWFAPASNGGAAITGYTATAAPGGATCTSTGALTCTVNGLTNGAGYTFTVTATNSAGVGTASAASAMYTPMAAPTAPGAPTSVMTVWNPGIPPAGLASISVSWMAPVSNGGAAITGYTATATPGGANCTTTGALNCTITDLASNSYTVTVTATNAVGAGPASAPVTVGILAASSKQGFGIQKMGSAMVFSFPKTSENLRVSVIDMRGATVWSQTVGAGVGELVWNGKTARGSSVHGIHMVRLAADIAGESRVLAESRLLLMP